jgi:hypothetical protein
MKHWLLAATAAFSLSMGAASAAVIYDESVSGDLDAIGSTNVNLVLGLNEIIGSIPGTPPADTDRIKFTQVAPLIVDSITLIFTSPFDPFGLGTTFNTDLHNNQANLFDDNFDGSVTGDVSASFFDSFGPETGPLIQDAYGTIWDFQISAGTVYPFQDWKLTIITSEGPPVVPLPASAPLILAAFGGLALLRRRKSI